MRIEDFREEINETIKFNAARLIEGQSLNKILNSAADVLETVKSDAASGIKGNAYQNNAPTVYTPEAFPDGLFETYRVTEQTNSASAWGLDVSLEDLKNNEVFFDVANGVVTKRSQAIKTPYDDYLAITTDNPVKTKAEWVADQKAENIIPVWSDSTKIFNSGLQTIHESAQYKALSQTSEADVPGVSDKWEKIIGTAEYFNEKNTKDPVSASQVFDFTEGSDLTANKVLKSFLKSEDEKIIKTYYLGSADNILFGVQGVETTLLKPDNTLVGYYAEPSYEFRVWQNILVKDFDQMDIDFTRFGGDLNAPAFVNLLGIKADGTIELLIAPDVNPPTNVLENKKFDLRPYQYISMCLFKPNSSFRTVKVEFITSGLVESYRLTEEGGDFNYLFGVAGAVTTLLRSDNTLVGYYAEPNNLFRAWQNIPVAGFERIKIDFIRQSSIPYVTLLGIRHNGDIDVLIDYKILPNELESLNFYLAEYEYISLSLSKEKNSTDDVGINFYEGRFIENDAVKNYIDYNLSNKYNVNSDKLIFIPEPTSLMTLNIEGEMPTDASDTRKAVDGIASLSLGSQNLFRAKCDLAIQGNATATAQKKGFEIHLMNFEDKELSVQVGDWIPCSEFHLKSYPNDRTFSRDLTAVGLWQQMRKANDFPESYISKFDAGTATDTAKNNFKQQALFYTDGYPIEITLNGEFYGIYVLRLKKERDNYRFDNANAKHIFLDNEAEVNWLQFQADNWKIRSPKMSGYIDGGIPPNNAVNNNLIRLFNWFAGLADESVNFESTYSNFINIGSWVDYEIAKQLSWHWDNDINNILLGTWDGTVWSRFLYDGDQTFGIGLQQSAYQNPFWFTVDENRLVWRRYFHKDIIYPKLKSRIQARYTFLRNSGIIDANNIYKTILKKNSLIPDSLLIDDLKKWTADGQLNENKQSVKSIMAWTINRIAELDAIWKLP